MLPTPCGFSGKELKKTKNTNEMILGAYTEELNLFQMLVPDYSF
jgi:hypothetical protein